MFDLVENPEYRFSHIAAHIINKFSISVYLYGEAATEDHRKTLPQVRAGEYEGLPDKVWKMLVIAVQY